MKAKETELLDAADACGRVEIRWVAHITCATACYATRISARSASTTVIPTRAS